MRSVPNHLSPPSVRHAASLLVAAAALVLTATGCTSKSDTKTAAPAGKATTVNVDLTEFKLGLSQKTFKPGTYTFVAKDAGHTVHALSIDGPGLEDKATDKLTPGKSGSLTVTLKKGTYKLYCPVGHHEAQGMKTQITVA